MLGSLDNFCFEFSFFKVLMMDLVWRIEMMGKMMMIPIMRMVVTTLTAVVVGRSNLRSTQEVS